MADTGFKGNMQFVEKATLELLIEAATFKSFLHQSYKKHTTTFFVDSAF